jgi:hypothetical protein
MTNRWDFAGFAVKKMQRPVFLLGLLLATNSLAYADNFGAIAYNQTTGAWGLATDHPSQEAAVGAAVSECSKYGSGCVVVVRFANQCAAYARGSKGESGWQTSWLKRTAEFLAKARCKDRSCKVVASACTAQPSPSGNPNQPGFPPRETTYDQMKRECVQAGGGNLDGGQCVKY